MIKTIFKLSPIQIGLLLILMPFSVGVLEGIISLISIFKDFVFEIPLVEIAIFIVHIIYLLWIWSLSVTINEKTLKIDNKLFKISFLFYLSFRLVDFLINLNLYLFKKEWLLENQTINMIEIIMVIYGLITFISYVYLAIFTGKIITKISINKPKRYIDGIPNFLFIIVFPLGIPLLQAQIRNYLKENKLFGFKQSKNIHLNNYQQKPQEKIEVKTTIKKKVIDKEDPTRFMPK